jgi:hypothetical protein
LFLGTNSVVSENFDNLNWDNLNSTLYVGGQIQLVDGNQQVGYVLTSDTQGLASWQQNIFSTQSIVEVPISGTQNNLNKSFVLSNLIVSPVDLFFINGQLLQRNLDYTISGTALSLTVNRPAPSSSDTLRIFGSIADSGNINFINNLTAPYQFITTSNDGNFNFSVNSSVDTHTIDLSLSDTITGGRTFSNDVNILENLTVGSNSNYSGDLLPTTDATFNLGSPSLEWNKLWIASQSLYVGGVTISSDSDAITINRLNLGTEQSPVIVSASGSDIFVNGNLLSSNDIVTLTVAKQGSQFTSVKTAVDSITDATDSNVYTVKVSSGIYYEEPFTIPSYVVVVGESSVSTIIQATYSNQTLITLSDQSAIFDVQIQGCTGTGVAAIVYSSPTTPQTNAIAYVENVRFGSNYTHVRVVGTASGNCIVQCSNVKYGGYPFTIGFEATNNGSGVGRMQLRNVTSTNGGITTTAGLIFAKTNAQSCGFIVNGCLLTKSVGAAAGIGFQVENGGFLRLTGVNFQRWSKAIYAPSDAGSPSIDAIAINFENNTIDVQIDNPNATGKIQGVDNYLKTIISLTASLYVVGRDQRKIVVAKKGGDFSSIKSAVASITDSSTTNRYVIEVGPGEFVEENIDLTSKPYISIVGSNIQTTVITASASNHHILSLGATNEISFLSLRGAGSGYAAIEVDDIGSFAQAHKVSIYDCDINVLVKSSSQDTIFYGEYLDFNGTFTYGLKVESLNGYQALANIENYYVFPGVTGSIANYGTGTSSVIDVVAARLEGFGDDYAFWIQNGSELNISAINILNFEYGIYNPNVGIGTTFDVDGASIVSSLYDIYVDSPTTFGTFQGSADHTRVYKDPSSQVYWSFLDRVDGELDITRKISITYDSGERVDLSTLLLEGSTMGILSGGVITSLLGLTVSVSSGYGYLETNTGVIKRVDWSTSQYLLTNNSSEYIYINQNEILTSSSTIPDITNNIVIGRVATYANEIVFIDNTRVDSKHAANKLNLFNRKALGSIYESGSIVTSATFSLNVTSGSYYFGESNFLPTGGTGITFSQFYRDGVGGWIISTTNSVTSQYDNNTGSLITMSASYFTKHTLYVVGEGVDEKYLLVVGQTQYSALVDVESASLPIPPTYFEDGVTPIASVYVRQGDSTTYQVEDIRPVIGFKSSGVNATSLHSNLLGLSNDDHTQYLRVDGFRAMTDDLQMGSNSITGVDLINGVNITTHASRHLPNGADPLSTGVPSNVGTTNDEGIQNAFSRQDHVHALGTDVVSDSNILAHTSSKISIVNKSQLNSSIVYIDQSNTFGTFSNIFKSSNLSLTNPANTFNYTFVGSGISSNQNITLPLLLSNDTFVFENHVQTLTNKTLTSPIITNPTVSNPYVTGFATFSRMFILDAPIDNNEIYKLAVNSSHEVIKVPLDQRADFYMNNNTTTTLTATNSWTKISGVGNLSNQSSSSFTYSSSSVTILSATGDGGFENTITTGTQGFADNGWVVVNGVQSNRWFVGATGASGSGFGAYISNNNGVSNAYTTTAASAVHFYRDIVIPPYTNTVNISFAIRTTGENIFDYIRVYNTATNFTPVAGSIYTGQLAEYSVLTGYNTQTVSFTPTLSTSSQSRRIIFSWRNDTSAGAQPPASIDNISITYNPLLEITYTGSQSTFKSVLTGSLQAASGIASVGIQIAKNGFTSSNISEASFSVSTNYRDAFAVQNTFTMSNGDTVAPFINNKSSAVSVLVNDFLLNLIQID